MLLNRRRIEEVSISLESSSSRTIIIPVSLQERIHAEPLLIPTQTVPRGQPMALLSSIALLSGSIYIAASVNFAIVDCVLSQQAFDACSILFRMRSGRVTYVASERSNKPTMCLQI